MEFTVFPKVESFKAAQFDGSDEMVEKYKMLDAGTMIGIHHSPELYLEGAGKIVVGDWIVPCADGDFRIITNEDFAQKYADLPVIPKKVAAFIKAHKNVGFGLPDILSSSSLLGAVSKWLAEDYDKHEETLCRAWLDGYLVEAQHER